MAYDWHSPCESRLLQKMYAISMSGIFLSEILSTNFVQCGYLHDFFFAIEFAPPLIQK